MVNGLHVEHFFRGAAGGVANGKLGNFFYTNFVGMWITRVFCDTPGIFMTIRVCTFILGFSKNQKLLPLASSKGIYIGAAALAIGYFLLRKSAAAGNLVFFPGNVTGMAFIDSTPQITFELRVQNTSGTDLLLNSLAGNLSSNGYLVGNVSNFSGAVIPGNSQVVIPLTVSLQVIGIVTDLIRAFQYKNFTQNIDLDARANVNNIQVPVQLSYSVGK